MDRRGALKIAAACLAIPTGSLQAAEWSKNFGAQEPTGLEKAANSKAKSFYEVYSPMRGIALQGQKNTFLWDYLGKEIGEIKPHWQGTATNGEEGEGDCVAHAAAMGVDSLSASQIHLLGMKQKFHMKAAVEPIYWGSRVEIGNGGAGSGEGSRGVWAAKYLKKYGVLHRKKYSKGNESIDLTGYSPARSRQYKRTGVPDWLESISREHPVKEITNVKTGMEALDAVASGQPVILCSSYKFHKIRDEQGFAPAYVSRKDRWKRGWNPLWEVYGWPRGFVPNHQWYHAMVLTGALVEGGRIGGAIQNSHGIWNNGPQPHNLPDGAFFADLKVIDLMVKDWFDCWALGSYHGHQSKRMKHKLYRRRK